MAYRIISLSVFIFLFITCSKTEGPGGTSSITGVINGIEFNEAEKEVLEILVTPGADLEHGDYFVLNTPVGGTLYYVWFNNPMWVSDGDPALSGRTGIEVGFNYSDSNTEIATALFNALTANAGSDFTITQQNDILTLTCIQPGNVADANSVSTEFEIEIVHQGENEFKGDVSPVADAKVFIVYGDQQVYGDDTRTDGEGEFIFNNLVKGSYTLYVVSQDTLNPSSTINTSVTVTIEKNKSVVDAGTLIWIE